MEEHIGEVFEGVISSITKWGIYVELPNTIEGLVHVTNMHDDHYDYIEERFEMVESIHGKSTNLDRLYILWQQGQIGFNGRLILNS